MRKRNSTRHVFTIARRQYLPDTDGNRSQDWADDDYMYLRGTGLVQPTPSVSSIETTNGFNQVVDEISVITNELAPRIDNRLDETDPRIAFAYRPDAVMWNGVPYKVYGQTTWKDMGKSNDYKNNIAIFDTADGIQDANLIELKWEEIDAFQSAVDQTEMAIELVLNKVVIPTT